jgi:hypothetical protein
LSEINKHVLKCSESTLVLGERRGLPSGLLDKNNESLSVRARGENKDIHHNVDTDYINPSSNTIEIKSVLSDDVPLSTTLSSSDDDEEKRNTSVSSCASRKHDNIYHDYIVSRRKVEQNTTSCPICNKVFDRAVSILIICFLP